MDTSFEILTRDIHVLKHTVRTGWLEAGIYRGESIAGHMYHAAVIALVLRRRSEIDGVDWGRVVEYCLLHDLAEARVGDVPAPKKTDEDRRREAMVLSGMLEELGIDMPGGMDDGSPEALLCKLSEQLATLLQGYEYWRRGFRDPKVMEIIGSSLGNVEDLLGMIGDNGVRSWVGMVVERVKTDIQIEYRGK